MQYRILSSAVAAVLMAAVSARAETTVVFNNYLSETIYKVARLALKNLPEGQGINIQAGDIL